MNTDTFIERAKNIHGDKYDYSSVNYINTNTIVTIICKEHGQFPQIPDFHLNRKCGCPKCSNNIILTIDEFIEKVRSVHGDKYDYSQVNYVQKLILFVKNMAISFKDRSVIC